MSKDLPEGIKSSLRKSLNLAKVKSIISYTGFSGAGVWLILATAKNDLHKFLIVKVDKPDRIEREVKNWKKYAQFLNRIHAVQLVSKNLKGQNTYLAYDCASQYPKNPRLMHMEFKDHYNKVENPCETIRYLFKDVLNPWHRKKELMKEDLKVKFNDKIIDKGKKEIIKALESIFPGFDSNRAGLDLSSLKGENLKLRNPSYVGFFPESGDWVVVSPISIIHGDLNPKNILIFPHYGINVADGNVERKEFNLLCVIDFYHTGEGNLFEDIAMLEASIKFQIFNPEDINWKHLIAFEDFITRKLSIQTPPPQLFEEDREGQLQKLYNSIRVLRDKANDVLEDKNFSDLSYWVYLYILSLKHILYEGPIDNQKRYAFISASMIFDKYIYKHAWGG